MIQAGTMSTGSACTDGVVGVYWISSISSLRNTTLPGVTATFLPTSNSSVPAGTLPFIADSMPQLCALVLENSAPPISAIRPDIPEGLAEAVAKCLQKKVDDRFENVAELAKAIAPYAGDFGPASAARVQRILGGTVTSKVDGTAVRAALSSMHQSAVPNRVNTTTSFGRTSADPGEVAVVPEKKGPPWVPIGVGGALLIAAIAALALRPRGEAATAAEIAARSPNAAAASASAATVALPAASATNAPTAVAGQPTIEPAKSADTAPLAGVAPDKTAVRVPGPMPKGPPPKGGDKGGTKEPPKSGGDVFGDRKLHPGWSPSHSSATVVAPFDCARTPRIDSRLRELS